MGRCEESGYKDELMAGRRTQGSYQCLQKTMAAESKEDYKEYHTYFF